MLGSLIQASFLRVQPPRSLIGVTAQAGTSLEGRGEALKRTTSEIQALECLLRHNPLEFPAQDTNFP